MQSREYKVAGLGCGQRKRNGFRVAYFADQYDIRVFTQCSAQGLSKCIGVLPQFALVNDAVFGDVYKFYRVFNGQNLRAPPLVD
jgi:hypothetical protein